MGELKTGQQVGSWKALSGQANITVKQEIGQGYESQEAAAKAAFGKEAVITEESDGQYHAYTIDDGSRLDHLNLGEKVTAKSPVPSAKVVDFIGKDGFQLQAGQKVLPAIGKDNGKVVYFMRHLSSGILDKVIVNNVNNVSLWNEEINQARKKGYTVILDTDATKDDMWNAFYDQRAAGIIFFGHGFDKGLSVGNGEGKETLFSPSNLDPNHVSPHLKLLTLQSCDAGKIAGEWRHATNNATFSGYTYKVPGLLVALSNSPTVAQLAGGSMGIAGSLPGMLLTGKLAGDLLTHRLDRLIDQNL